MSNLVERVSRVPLSPDLIKLADPDDLLRGFAKTFSKLGAFKATRDKHASRGVGEKLWDLVTFDDTMEVAQLDAVETQEAFSKMLGQLMVLSIAQAQQLQDQQSRLVSQQEALGTQAGRIEGQASTIADQQKDLARQNQELDKLVREYFELKGLTLDGAAKLIQVAKEIQGTRDGLLESFGARVGELNERAATLEARFAAGSQSIEQRAEALASSWQDGMGAVRIGLAEQAQQVGSAIQAIERLQNSVADHGDRISGLGEGLAASVSASERANQDLRGNLEEAKRRLASVEATANRQFRIMLAVGVVAVVGAASGLTTLLMA